MNPVVKVLCSLCHGKVALDEDYYHELVGKTIPCPHCKRPMSIPGNTDRIHHQQAPFNDLRTTQKLQLVPVASAAPKPVPVKASAPDGCRCPHCGAEVGRRDRVCITCEGRLNPSA
ncbi:MAG: hypothetical protein A2498_16375 [Lentisphaerae bacterium RIFOXYC12_FULL_60_16]|nr:MAG: hypothetical protein A2498_16375 [Lentisphaerae bacterium RIFOXYC12_FULL_60_16]OGV73479.1 MAG: hypothetical protein A2269_04570 [Lentisphaerae bacterium RIFOXYA12_FULL_60_10]OGV83762.1 MAG: hypothetical protein A2340_01795 [Lentisphaerae bacterium RIFOXYB12_FULL_60_10]